MSLRQVGANLNQCWYIVNRTLGTDFSEILIEYYTFSFKKIPLRMSSAICRPSCLGLNELIVKIVARIPPSRFFPVLIGSNLPIKFVVYCVCSQNASDSSEVTIQAQFLMEFIKYLEGYLACIINTEICCSYFVVAFLNLYSCN